MPIPPAVVLDPEVFVQLNVPFSPSHHKAAKFFEDLPNSETQIYALEGLAADVLSGLVEEGWLDHPVDSQFAGLLFDAIQAFLANLIERRIIVSRPRQPLMKEAFRTAASTNLSLTRALAAELAISLRLPLVVKDASRRADIEAKLGWVGRLQVISLDDVY